MDSCLLTPYVSSIPSTFNSPRGDVSSISHTVLLRPNVHAMLHVTPIVHQAICSWLEVTRYWTGKCSLWAEVHSDRWLTESPSARTLCQWIYVSESESDALLPHRSWLIRAASGMSVAFLGCYELRGVDFDIYPLYRVSTCDSEQIHCLSHTENIINTYILIYIILQLIFEWDLKRHPCEARVTG